MQRYKNLVSLAVIVLAFLPSAIMAQSYGSINTYSPYSMYGLGELQTQGSLSIRSMGGVGVAMRSGTEINITNPAASSSAFRKSILFSYGAEGSNYFNRQTIDGVSQNNSYASFNFHDIAIQLPLAKDMGMTVSIAPYSSVGYKISTSEIFSDIGYISYLYEGGGDITEVKVGAGWEIFKGFSVGLAAQYYWGVISRSFTMSPYVVTGNGVYYATIGETSYTVSTIKAQAGLQWTPISTSNKILTFGLTYDLGGDLSPEYNHIVIGESSLFSISAVDLTEDMSLVMPSKIVAGVSYNTPKLLLGAEYEYQDWYSQNADLDNSVTTDSGVEIAYNDFSTFKLGAQYTPNRNDVRRYMRRVAYRAGLNYGGYQHTFGSAKISQYAATVGLSLPMKMNGVSKVDLGLEYGSRGSSDVAYDSDGGVVNMIRQNYIKFSVGITLFGEDYWFQRPKFD